MPALSLASFENDDMDEECDEEVSSSSTSPNTDGRNESMSTLPPNSLEDTNDGDHYAETTMNADECDEDEEVDSSKERLSNEANND